MVLLVELGNLFQMLAAPKFVKTASTTHRSSLYKCPSCAIGAQDYYEVLFDEEEAKPNFI